MERYGLDVKWMYPVNRWLAFDAQLGWTGFCSMAVDWECSRMERVSGLAGVRVYLEKVIRNSGLVEDGSYTKIMAHWEK